MHEHSRHNSFEQWWALISERAYAIAIRYTRDSEAAQDCVAQTHERLLSLSDQYQALPKDGYGWTQIDERWTPPDKLFFATLRNVTLNWLRAARRPASRGRGGDTQQLATAPAPDWPGTLDLEDELCSLRRCLETMPEPSRSFTRLYWIGNLSLSQVREQLDLPGDMKNLSRKTMAWLVDCMMTRSPSPQSASAGGRP